MASKPLKRPVSVLVVIHSPDGEILMLERADRTGFWQSVTGSLEVDETPFQAALREVAEEIGVHVQATELFDWQEHSEYEIYLHWRHRYPEGVAHNTEHVFSLCLPKTTPICLSPNEHVAYQWLPEQVARDLAFSPSNQAAIARLPQRLSGRLP